MASKDTDTPFARLVRKANDQDQPALRTQSNSPALRIQSNSPALSLDDGRQIRIVLLGKTGVGKSSIGNLLLNRAYNDQAFRADESPQSVTKECSRKQITVDGKEIVVVDTPGFFDTYAKNENERNKLIDETTATLIELKPGPHVFLIALTRDRITEQELKCLEIIEKLFDGNIFKHAVVIFPKSDMYKKPIGEYVAAAGIELKDFLKKCGNRYDSINADPEEESGRQNNRQKVMKLINDLITQNNNSYFTSRLLEEVQSAIKMSKEGVGRLERDKTRSHTTGTYESSSEKEAVKVIVGKHVRSLFRGK